jgi:hypothetical protein
VDVHRALGFVAYAAGDFAWCLHDVLGFTGVPPRLEDAFYLACYPLFVAGLFGLSLSGRQLLETSVRQLLDAALIFVSAFCARSWLSSFSYWAATTVTPLSVAAVSCGDVVVHVTVEPAVSVVHVYVFGPPDVSVAWTWTFPLPVFGIAGLIVKVSASMLLGVVASSA